MGERMTVGRESWRPPVRESAFDGQAKRMAVMAGGVVAVLGLGYAGYAVLNRAPRAVPVIEADSRPIRVKPDNPGGMQIVGAEEQIMGDKDAGQADVMAPPPEQPQPQVLKAQIQAARQSTLPPPPAPVQPVSLATPPAPPLPAISAAPETRPAVPPAPPAKPRTVSSMQVQLAAMDTEAGATAEWQRLARKMPDLFHGKQPAVTRTDKDGKVFWRLRTAGFSDPSEAARFCTEVKAKGGGCAVASF
jgi:hypothetical protein